jgi:hypothetical protein
MSQWYCRFIQLSSAVIVILTSSEDAHVFFTVVLLISFSLSYISRYVHIASDNDVSRAAP